MGSENQCRTVPLRLKGNLKSIRVDTSISLIQKSVQSKSIGNINVKDKKKKYFGVPYQLAVA